jgi:hypothetical protein
MKKAFAVFLLLFSINLFAQDIPDSMLVNGWNPTGIVGLNLSQVAYKLVTRRV